jgi:lysophospholipase L1-like esterase
MKLLSTRAVLAGLLVLSSAVQALGQSTSDQLSARPHHMLVVGDSISWGQGLKNEHKSWYLLKLWLEKHTARPVVEKVIAHSGAVIERRSTTDNFTADDGEVNVGLPTINDELDRAIQFYPDRSAVDLVLVSGCGNDVGLQNLLNATSSADISRMTEDKCGPPMERLLRKIRVSFPIAQVVVVGYYPFFSEKTRNDFIMRAVARRLLKTTPGGKRLDAKEVMARLINNSGEWYRASNKTFAGAIERVNAELGNERVKFAKVEFPPEYSFAAKETRLWGLNRSPFRMMLVLLSFGKVMLPTNDEVRGQRKASCDVTFRATSNESKEERIERKNRRTLCRYAALGHPNRKGAMLYAEAISNALQPVLALRN